MEKPQTQRVTLSMDSNLAYYLKTQAALRRSSMVGIVEELLRKDALEREAKRQEGGK